MHSDLAPSAATRWVSCPGSVDLIRANGPFVDSAGEAATRGTLMHEWADFLLTGVDEPDQALLDPEIDIVEHYAAVIEAENADVLHVETKVPLFYKPEDTGTVDCHYQLGDTLCVDDLKTGRFEVQAVDNKQLLIYAWSIFRAYFDTPKRTINSIRMRIIQPTVAPSVKEWVITVDEAWDKAADIAIAANTADAGSSRLVASEAACRWCPVAAVCSARAKWVLEVLDDDPLDLPDPRVMTDESLVIFVERRKEIEKWLKDVGQHLQDKMLSGGKVDGLKVVLGREGNRTWADEQKAAETLIRKFRSREIYKKTLISPAQAGKLLKKVGASKRLHTRIASFVRRASASPVVVVADDKRPALPDAMDLLTNDGEQ